MKALQIKVNLKNFDYYNYRTILMSPSNTFEELHQCIQSLFGFENMHLWKFDCFQNNKLSFEITKPFDDEDDNQVKTYGIGTKLSKMFLDKGISELIYEYDFGDSRYFDVSFEKEIETQYKLPKVVGGEGMWLLEDCGGPWGLEDLIEVYNNGDKKEAEEMGWDDWQELKETIEGLYKDTDWENFPSEKLL